MIEVVEATTGPSHILPCRRKMKSVCFALCAWILAVVLQGRPSFASLESVCQLHQLEFTGNGTYILSGQVRYTPLLSPAWSLANAFPVYFTNMYNVHIHSPMYEGRYFQGFLKIVDTHYFAIKTAGGENGGAAMGLERVAITGNAKTTTQTSMEALFKSIINNISSFSVNGTRLIFQGTKSNLVCNRIPAL
jgi:hypothetical protein